MGLIPNLCGAPCTTSLVWLRQFADIGCEPLLFGYGVHRLEQEDEAFRADILDPGRAERSL